MWIMINIEYYKYYFPNYFNFIKLSDGYINRYIYIYKYIYINYEFYLLIVKAIIIYIKYIYFFEIHFVIIYIYV